MDSHVELPLLARCTCGPLHSPALQSWQSTTCRTNSGERKPDDSLLLLLEGIGGLDADEKHVIKEIVEGILLKQQAKRLIRL